MPQSVVTSMNRCEPVNSTGFLLAGSPLDQPGNGAPEVHSARILITEAHNPPFIRRSITHPGKCVRIARELNSALTIRSWYHVYFSRIGYPVHRELMGDPMRGTVDLCHKSVLSRDTNKHREVAKEYLPIADVRARNPDTGGTFRIAAVKRKRLAGHNKRSVHKNYSSARVDSRCGPDRPN